MLIDSLTFALEKSGCLDAFWGKLDEDVDATLGVAASARPFLVSARFAHVPQATLVVVAGEDAAVTFARGVATYLGESRVMLFPERTDYPFEPQKSDARIVARRMQAAWALQTRRPVVVVASARSLLRLLPPASAKAARPIVLRGGCELANMGNEGVSELDDLKHALVSAGYEDAGELEGPGTFTSRGGIIDIFPGNLSFPVRLDFFGDELEEIRRIVPATGQTISPLEVVEIYPVSEFPVTAENLARARKALEKPALTNPALRKVYENLEGGLRFDGADVLLPYLHKHPVALGAYASRQVLTSLIEPRSLFDDAAHAFDDISERASGTNVALEGLYASPSALDFGGGVRATYVSIMRVGGDIDEELPVKRVDVSGSPDKIFGKLKTLAEDGYTVVFAQVDFRARERMKLSFVDYGIPIAERLDLANEGLGRGEDDSFAKRRLRRGMVNIVEADIPLGMIIPKAKIALVSAADMQGSRSATRKKSRIDVTQTTFPFKPGDYVVHAAHGIAFFRCLVRRDIEGVERDYLQLEYAGGDKLFVPVEQLDRVTRYVGPEGSSPRLTRLNTSDWSRALKRARKATKKLAFDLVDVYARRAATQGFRFSPDTPWQHEMEDAFPYQETPDQLAAIAEVKADMESSRPMDRLICGDVGFGKTEVALRAAFKATQDNKQVMVLCPTTILAQQHYTSFSERFAPFNVRVEVLSRFRTSAQQKKALEGFAAGEVDVLVGTHRLLSRDVNPHDLGLVIVDEEQRFGVQHKEQLKNLRESIDVLTLSATPIPRTMQMSLSGVRDMSLILTPPDERLAVKVHVGEWDPDVVSAAIRFELARGGQVYYVSNRVRSVNEAAERVSAAAGEARVGIAHGQMTKEELERVMEDFSAGELDVLVATTIIESGIDNPHTNTLIIEDSQRLGLAQMYQLKGRVGRSSVQAYAYFMFPENVALTEEATARLTAIGEHQDLGSGMRVAMRDLEIRGAGDILGAEQSGNMSQVGFDLFAQMLASAVNATREGIDVPSGELPPALSDITVNVPGHAYLPEEYIPEADVRVMWYRRLACAAQVEEVEDLRRELVEKAPEMPAAAENLFIRSRLRAFANEHGIKTITVATGKLIVEPVEVSREKMTPLRRFGGRYLSEKRKLAVPLRAFYEGEDDALMPAVYRFLENLLDAGSDGASADAQSASSHVAAAVAGRSSHTTVSTPSRSKCREITQARGDAARDRLAAKRAARAASREQEQ